MSSVPIITAPSKRGKCGPKPGKRAKPKPEGSDAYGRLPHPLVGSTSIVDGKAVYPFEIVPSDFNRKTHQRLSKKDFKDESVYFIHSAEQYERMAASLRKKASTSKIVGTGEDKKAAIKMLRMQEQMDLLRRQLEGKGVDVDALLAAQPEAAEEAAA